jgi:hypothetical protein
MALKDPQRLSKTLKDPQRPVMTPAKTRKDPQRHIGH